MTDARAYTVSVQFGTYAGDTCFEARVAEFPEIREYADTFAEAYDLAINTIAVVVQHLTEQGFALPAPLVSDRTYSGRVTLRLPRTIHRDLAEAAEREGVSFNQHVVNMLCYAQGKAESTERNARKPVTYARHRRHVQDSP